MVAVPSQDGAGWLNLELLQRIACTSSLVRRRRGCSCFVCTAVRSIQKQLGWTTATDRDDWDLYWTDTSVSQERVIRLNSTQVGCLKQKAPQSLQQSSSLHHTNNIPSQLTARLPGEAPSAESRWAAPSRQTPHLLAPHQQHTLTADGKAPWGGSFSRKQMGCTKQTDPTPAKGPGPIARRRLRQCSLLQWQLPHLHTQSHARLANLCQASCSRNLSHICTLSSLQGS